MSESKIQIKVGIVEFSGEGNQDWLATQLDKILGKVPELLKIELNNPPNAGGGNSNNNAGGGNNNSQAGKPTNLPAFLKEKAATTNQTKKFLATAAFIQLGGKDRMMTSDVFTLLNKTNQTKINNAADTLNKNVGKGQCTKDGSSFYVTPEGFTELSINID
ncbi:MAG: hypothetical protein H0W62_09515 [Chitinophagales bacterium]|nr:hypothetical protein [Chitinophagales bacterium]